MNIVSKFDAKISLQKLSIIDRHELRDSLMILPTTLTFKKQLADEPFVDISIFFDGLVIGMGVDELLRRTTVSLHHTWVSLEIIYPFLVVCQRATHAAQSSCRVYAPVLTIIERMEFYSSFLYKRHHVFIGPVKNGIERLRSLFLPSSAVDTAFGRFLIAAVTFRTLRLADA